MITQEYLKELFTYDNGVLYWKVNRGRRAKAGSMAGHNNYNKKGDEYRWKINIDGKKYARYRLVYLMHHGYLPLIVDHKNAITTDDRIENLRAATVSQNSQNAKMKKSNSSGFKGVYLNRHKTRYIASITANRKVMRLGSFSTAEEAAAAYEAASIKYHGEFRRTDAA